MTKRIIQTIICATLIFTLFVEIIKPGNSQARSMDYIEYSDNFSSYAPGLPPTGWLIRGSSQGIPTIQEVGGFGPDYRLVNFPEVSWQYWDSWLLKEDIIASGDYDVAVKMNFQNSIADRAGLTIAWNDTNWNRIDIQPNVYGDEIEFRVAYTGPIEYQLVINRLANITINAYTNYWLKVITQDQGPGNGIVDVYWSSDNATFTQVLHVSGVPTLTGMVGMSTAGPHLPRVYFDDFIAKTSSSLPDISLEGPIQAGNIEFPYRPDHVTLSANVENNSTQLVQNLQVAFYDGNPDTGGTVIGTTLIGELGAGATRTVSTDWNLAGNLENHQVYTRATIIDSEDANPSNNTISRPISVFYVDFRHDRDAYSFGNNEVGRVNLNEILGFLADFDIPEIWWNPLLPIFGILFEVNGYCYGMSNSSLIYVNYPHLKPNPNLSTFDLTLDEGRDKIRTYQWYAIGPMLRILMGLTSSDPDEQYQQTLNNIRNGNPVIHGLMERNGILPEKGSHSLVAYKIIDLGDEKRVFYYDNNLPLKIFSADTEETYGVFNDAGFSEPFYSRITPYQYNSAYVVAPQPSSSDSMRILWDFINWIFRYHILDQTFSITAEGATNLLAVDSLGRQAGYIDGIETNEIPGSQVTTLENVQMLILPTSDVYQFDITGTELNQATTNESPASNISLSIFDPISETQSLITEFQEIYLNVNEKASFQYVHGQQKTMIVLPDDTSITSNSTNVSAPGYRLSLPMVINLE